MQTELAFPVCKSTCDIDAFAGLSIAPFYQGRNLWTTSNCLVALEAVWLFVIVIDGAAHDTRSSREVGRFGVVIWQDS
jgi:hypothetical protein